MHYSMYGYQKKYDPNLIHNFMRYSSSQCMFKNRGNRYITNDVGTLISAEKGFYGAKYASKIIYCSRTLF